MTPGGIFARRWMETVVLVGLMGSNYARAQCQPTVPDSSFQVSGQGDNNNGVYAGWQNPANSLPYQTSRVVGPGTAGEFNGGTLRQLVDIHRGWRSVTVRQTRTYCRLSM